MQPLNLGHLLPWQNTSNLRSGLGVCIIVVSAAQTRPAAGRSGRKLLCKEGPQRSQNKTLKVRLAWGVSLQPSELSLPEGNEIWWLRDTVQLIQGHWVWADGGLVMVTEASTMTGTPIKRKPSSPSLGSPAVQCPEKGQKGHLEDHTTKISSQMGHP